MLQVQHGQYAMKLSAFLCLSFLFFGASGLIGLAQAPTILTYAGSALPANGSQGLTQAIGIPLAVSADGAGGFYVASNQSRVYHVTPDGVLTVTAGTGSIGAAGDNGPASAAQLNYVQGIAVDGSGNVFIADSKNNRIREITFTGVITTIAGTGSAGAGGDGGSAVSAQLSAPRGLAIDQAGNLFIADTSNNKIRMVTPAGIISTVAGNGVAGFTGDGGSAVSAQLNVPVAVAVDRSGNIFISDRNNNRIRMVNSAGTITTVVGSTAGFSGDDGPAASAQISNPVGVAVDGSGNLFIADAGNNRIRTVSAGGIISTFAGKGTAGFSGDGGPSASAQLTSPVDVTVDGSSNVFIADRGNYRIRQVNSAGVITSVAGRTGDGGPAAFAQFYYPNTVAASGAGDVFIADTDIHRIRKIDTAGVITTVAGNGTGGFSGDGGPATSAQLYFPAAIAVDAADNLFIADTRNDRIRKVTPGGVITTIAGSISEPAGIAVDGAGNVYISETGAHRVRQINTAGSINIIAGNGTEGFSGDGGPATSAQLAFPAGIAVDRAGDVFIADSVNNRIRMVTPNGVISTVAGNGTSGFAGDGGPAMAAEIGYPQGVAVDLSGTLFIADTNNERIRKVTPDGLISTVAGNGIYGSSGDGGPASAAEIAGPYSVAVGGLNSLFIADTFSSRIREVVSPVVPFTIPDLGAMTLTSSGNPESTTNAFGLIQEANGNTAPAGVAILSYRSGDYLVSETGVPATAPLLSGRIYAEINGPVDTGLAIANPNSQAANVNFYFTDAAGNNVGSGTTTIATNQQIARFLDSYPFNTLGGVAFQGTFSFTSDVPVVVLAIRGFRNERNEFLMSTLPVIDTTAAPRAGTAVIPHFSDGGGWTTQILLVNPGDTALAGTVEFRRDDGGFTNISMAGQSKNTFPYTVPPGSSQKLTTDGTASTVTSGSVRIIPGDGGAAPLPLVIFSYKAGGAVTVSQAGVGSTSGTTFRIYAESSRSGGPGSIQSGIAFANDTSTPATVTLELANSDGSSTGLPASISQTLPPAGHISEFLSQAFPGLPNPFKGIVRISSTSAEISVIGLRGRYNERGDFLISTTPPAAETASSGAAQLVFPHLPEGGGYTAQIILFSQLPGQSVSGSLVLIKDSGQPLAAEFR